MNQKGILKIHPEDNVVVALQDLPGGAAIEVEGKTVELAEDIPMKHKFVTAPLAEGDEILMYGVLVGKSYCPDPGRRQDQPEQHPSRRPRVCARDFTAQLARSEC